MSNFGNPFEKPPVPSEGGTDNKRVKDVHKAEKMAYAEKPFRNAISEENLAPKDKKLMEQVSEHRGEKAGKEYDEEQGKYNKKQQEKEAEAIEALKEQIVRKISFFQRTAEEGEVEKKEKDNNNIELQREVEQDVKAKVDSIMKEGKSLGKSQKEIMAKINQYAEAVNEALWKASSEYNNLQSSYGNPDRYVWDLADEVRKTEKYGDPAEKQEVDRVLKYALNMAAHNYVKRLRKTRPEVPIEDDISKVAEAAGIDLKDYIGSHISLFNEKRTLFMKTDEEKNALDKVMEKYGYFWSKEEKGYILKK